MPRLEYFLVAESVSIDRDRNQVSVFNILEEVFIPRTEPRVVPQLVALSSWILDPEDQGRDFQVQVELVGPDGDNCPYNTDFTVNFTANGTRQRTQIGLLGLPIEREGNTVFNLNLNGEHRASHILTVRANDDHPE
jgi:hypothetical protein